MVATAERETAGWMADLQEAALTVVAAALAACQVAPQEAEEGAGNMVGGVAVVGATAGARQGEWRVGASAAAQTE